MMDLLLRQPEVPGLFLRSLAALAFTAAAAYFDIFNKKWVPNYLVYGFLASALALNVIFFEQEIFTHALLVSGGVFAATYLLYKAGQLGGADAYVLTSISLCIPYFSSPFLAPAQEVPYPFILSVLAPTGLLFILHMVSRFLPYISRKISKGEVEFTAGKMAAPGVLFLVFVLFIYAASSLPFALPMQYVAILSFLFVSLLFFSLFRQEIKDSMVESVSLSKLQEEDVLALEKMKGSAVKKLNYSPLIGKDTARILRKMGLKSAPVYTKMPFFLPYLLLGLVFTLLFGDLLIYAAGV